MAAIVAALLAAIAGLGFDLRLSADLPAAMAQVGAALLVAYAVETSWVLKASRLRTARRRSWVGFTAAVGSAGLLGIAVCLVLAEDGGVSGLLAEVAFLWSAVSLLLLGLIVALAPFFAFEWSRGGDPDSDE